MSPLQEAPSSGQQGYPDYDGCESWLIEDYRLRTREIEVRLGLRQALLNYSALAFAGAGALLSFAHTYFSDWLGPLAFASGLLFLSLAVSYVRHDLFIAFNAQYVLANVLAQAGSRALGSPGNTRQSWEQFISHARGGSTSKKVLHKALAAARFGPILCVAVSFLMIGVAQLHSQNWLPSPPFDSLKSWGTLVSLVMCAASAILLVTFFLSLGLLIKEERAIAHAAEKLNVTTAASRKRPGLRYALKRIFYACPAFTVVGAGIWALFSRGFNWTVLGALLWFLLIAILLLLEPRKA